MKHIHVAESRWLYLKVSRQKYLFSKIPILLTWQDFPLLTTGCNKTAADTEPTPAQSTAGSHH